MTEEQKPDKTPKKAWYADALLMFSRLSIWIAVPVILASIIGNWLDRRYQSAPWMLIACVGFSFIVSMYGLIKETMKTFKKIEEDEAKKKK